LRRNMSVNREDEHIGLTWLAADDGRAGGSAPRVGTTRFPEQFAQF
jgi:hypothetical protein